MSDRSAPPDAEAPTCASCGAQLAPDQRYCLTCGTRSSHARLPFLDILRHPEPRAAAAPAAAAPAWARWQSHLPLAALTGLLLIALLIGVLLGHWAGTTPQVTPAAAGAGAIRVITVSPSAAPPAVAPAPSPPSHTSHKRSARRPRTAATPGAGAKNELQQIQHLSGKDYQRQIDKLGKKIGTGGKPPPKDNKAPAGGGSFQEIG